MPTEQTADKHAIIITRAAPLTEPRTVHIHISESDGVTIHATLADFLAELVDEVGNPALLVTQGQLGRTITAAAAAVTQRWKDHTQHV